MNRAALFGKIRRRLGRVIRDRLFLDQWILMWTRGDRIKTDFEGFQPLHPPRDRYWADPFVLERSGRHYVFIEEKVYAVGRGHIACLTLAEDGRILDQQTVLQAPYHLSYPFVFEHLGEIYLLPESAQHRTLDLYRCTRFPDRWEPAGTFLRDVYAVDATLLEHAGKWWLFANLKEAGGSSWDRLHLFYADSPLAKSWTPHPANPIVNDLSSARPAGRIFRRGPDLIRPSQDCSRRYGYAVKFNRILTLDEGAYRETTEAALVPPRGSEIIAAHTWNSAGGLTFIDALIRRRRFNA
jgi:hypothetical protein